MAFWIVLGLFLALLLYGVVIYNGLVALRNRIRNAFSQIDVQLQRRYELVPNLVETARAYMKHERETLEAVIQARNRAERAARGVGGDPANPTGLRELLGAEAALGDVLGRFFALAEAYPDLKANHNMGLLQEELASTENRIAFARQAYNDAVMLYNIQREQFPNNLLAGPFGFQASAQWTVDDSRVRQPVRVDFT